MNRYESIFILTAALVLSLVDSNSMASLAQQPPAGGQQSSSAQQQNAPISFFLKLKDGNNTTSQEGEGKNVTISVSVQKGPGGSPINLPVSAMVPSNTEAKDLELCVSLEGGRESCQPLDKLDSKLDLSSPQQNQSSNANMAPSAFNPESNILSSIGFLGQSQVANGQLISVNNTTLNIAITVIVPITVEIQNAQICATVASSGAQTCQQIVLNPTQTAYTPVNVDLSGTTPAITTAETSPTQTPTIGANSTSTGSSTGSQTEPSGSSTGTSGTNETSSTSVSDDNQKKTKDNKGQDKKSTESEPDTDSAN